MTTRGTPKFKYTDDLDNITSQTGFLGTPRSGVAMTLVGVMVIGLAYYTGSIVAAIAVPTIFAMFYLFKK